MRRSVDAFNRALESIQTILARTQGLAHALQSKYSLGESLRPLDLTGTFEARQRVLLDSREGLREAMKDEVARGLSEFVTDEVSEEVERRRERVTSIRGKGTMDAQAEEVRNFYDFLRQALRNALSVHLKSLLRHFSSELEGGLKPIGTELTQELQDALQERLDALESRLLQRDEQEKSRLVERLGQMLEQCTAAQERLRELDAAQRKGGAAVRQIARC